MAELNAIQALEKILTEADTTKIKTIFSNQCIKAQSFLINELRNQTTQQKEICNIISIGNVKLESEIKSAEQEINILIAAFNTIKSGNTELRKELLLTKEQKTEILRRIELGEKKYEKLWQSSKSRYESIPFVQKYLQGKKKSHLIETNLRDLQEQSLKLMDDINYKKNTIISIDKKRVIDLAKFLISDRPKTIKIIYVTINTVKELTKKGTVEKHAVSKIQLYKFKTNVELQNNEYIQDSEYKIKPEEKNEDEDKKKSDEILMPKLHLLDVDLDILSVNLEQIKKLDVCNEKRNTVITDATKPKLIKYGTKDEHSSICFNDMGVSFNREKNKNYSTKKLIHILNDVELQKNQSLEIISKLNPLHLKKVDFITSEVKKVDVLSENEVQESLEKKSTKNGHNTEKEILLPPTQFIDEKKNSQEKKKVTFGESIETFEHVEVENEQSNNIMLENGKINDTTNSLDSSSFNDEDYSKLKDKILKEHNLDLSPQFVYARHSVLQKKLEDKVITSKFFDPESVDKNDKVEKIEEQGQTQGKLQENNDISVSIGKSVSTVKNNQDIYKMEVPTTGYIFKPTSHGIKDSLNLSDSTAGFEDGDFPHCIDSSVLLSPKADVPVEITNNNIQSNCLEVPNFISGIRKTSTFFGWSAADCNLSTSTQNEKGNFNFNFNNEGKKNRGGFFSIFHK